MKLFNRLHALASLGICSILYFGWILPSLDVRSRLQRALSGNAVRVVVFGDNWSDTGSYRISPPSKDMMPIRAPERGLQWTEVLCQELLCDYVDNFARTLPCSTGMNGTGAVVSNQLMANATQKLPPSQSLADLESQIQQWVKFEKQKRLMPSRHFKTEWTLFTVFFGFWDVWQYSQLDQNDAERAVDKTILHLFSQLDVLAQISPVPVRIVLPLVVDITLLPGFKSRSSASEYPRFPQDQHRAIYLVEYWNTALSQVAAGWRGGKIYMPDLNQWVVNQLRDHQLWRLGMKDATGAGQQEPMFGDIETPCFSSANIMSEPKGAQSDTSSDASVNQTCAHAHRHLFWDETHLGGQAHVEFGKGTAGLIRANATINDWQDESTPAEANGKEENRKIRELPFDLVLPPGS